MNHDWRQRLPLPTPRRVTTAPLHIPGNATCWRHKQHGPVEALALMLTASLSGLSIHGSGSISQWHREGRLLMPQVSRLSAKNLGVGRTACLELTIQSRNYKTLAGSLKGEAQIKSGGSAEHDVGIWSSSGSVHGYQRAKRCICFKQPPWMTCQRLACEGHNLSLSFQLLFTTQPRALSNNRKNVIWLLFKARRYHSLWPTMAANRTGGWGGYKEPHSNCRRLSGAPHAHRKIKHTHTLGPGEGSRQRANWLLTSAALSKEPPWLPDTATVQPPPPVRPFETTHGYIPKASRRNRANLAPVISWYFENNNLHPNVVFWGGIKIKCNK